MKNLNKHFVTFPFMVAAIAMGLSSCTKHDQILDLTEVVTPTPTLDTDTLYSVSGTATLQPIGGGQWNGDVSQWSGAPALTVNAVVPDLGNGTFEGYIGNSTSIKMQSMHDASNIYFLMEFNLSQKNCRSAQWYYNPTTKKWAQESSVPALNSDNVTYRPAFIQDQLVLLFNVANSCPSFNTQSCYGACHLNSSYGGPINPGEGAMWTNGPTEVLDCWRCRALQPMNMNQAMDAFIDDGSSVGTGMSGTLNKNEVHGDWQVLNGPSSTVPPALQSPGLQVAAPGASSSLAADGGFTNKQNMQITFAPAGTKENIPIWVVPNSTYSAAPNYSAITLADTLSGAAVKVVGVDTNGVLYLANATTIDPRTGTDYKQVGSGDGPKCIPGSIVGAYTGSRGDVTCNMYYTGTSVKFLIKRALTTTDAVYDVNFGSGNDFPFGVGAMFNGADNQHAIVAGLTLHLR